ncbi:prepilin-type N-terminal cleavage/methylation domain-containing protein [Phormidium sp. FACHB-592]|uniref:Prepilin-type N-terminal cleavage/methylation domain-containing protein n=1 Tax=Stenomitos frigidus AS-A4 TaxID=2933935 RepID=A0ABV0KMT0_9CYAN|nr:GspH/FimT family pseudopilin [Phormidium sp. FACHB-592]MBD2074853.1 prepilin-type N-terminal cleavage/methylation domain-containing protein [Phormidium sp. FACHB-592]
MKNHRLLRQSTAGFTLIETLVVVIMIGVLFAIAAPGWLTFINRQRLGTANERILQTLRTAQAEAKRTQTYREARFDVASDPPRVAVLPLTSSTSGTGGAAVQTLGRIPDAQVNQWETLGQGEVRSGILTLRTSHTASNSIIFSPDGAVASTIQATTNPTITDTQPFTVTLALRGAPSVKRCVSVRTLLGAVNQKSDAACP